MTNTGKPLININESHIIAYSLDKESKDLQRYITLIKKYNLHDDPESLLSEIPFQDVKVSFSNSYTAFANGIRRALTDEINVQYLDVDDKDIVTNEERILTNDLISRLKLIPIYQDSDIDILSYNISLHVENKTNSLMNFYASDLVIKEKKGNATVPLNKIIPNAQIVLGTLFPARFITIRNIKFCEGNKLTKKADGCNLLSSVSMIPGKLSPEEKKKMIPDKRNLTTKNTDFVITFRTVGNVSADYAFKLVCTDLIKRLNSLGSEFKQMTKADYKSERITITKVDTRMSYLIENENITISNMIAEKIYELMPTIPFVSSSLVNYNEQKTRITIDHPQPYELIADAIKEIVNELNTFLAQIKKLPIDQQTYVP